MEAIDLNRSISQPSANASRLPGTNRAIVSQTTILRSLASNAAPARSPENPNPRSQSSPRRCYEKLHDMQLS